MIELCKWRQRKPVYWVSTAKKIESGLEILRLPFHLNNDLFHQILGWEYLFRFRICESELDKFFSVLFFWSEEH